MWTFLVNNAGTIGTALILAVVVICVARSMIRDRKEGKGSCGGSCGACGACGGGCALPPVGRDTRNR